MDYTETSETCREPMTKERLYEGLNIAIRSSEIIIAKEEARLNAIRRFKWDLDEYFEDLDRK